MTLRWSYQFSRSNIDLPLSEVLYLWYSTQVMAMIKMAATPPITPPIMYDKGTIAASIIYQICFNSLRQNDVKVSKTKTEHHF